jgi:oligopeptide transport system substrate-binding protein
MELYNTDIMKELSSENLENLPLNLHPSFRPVCQKLNKWLARFPLSIDNSIFTDLSLLFLLGTKKYLDHRTPAHLFRIVMSLHSMQKKLLRAATFSSQIRHLEIRLLSTNLVFPFSPKPVLGCLIGFNLMDRYEVFDEENVILALQKYLPQLRLVTESSYCHTSQHKNLKIFYFEIEQKNGLAFSHLEKNLLKINLEEKVKKSIQPLTPTIFMSTNNEEIYKNILVLSQEIQSLQDLPQAYITLDSQSGKEIIFRINLVHISPYLHFSLKERFAGSNFVSERILTVRHLDDHPIEAHIFRLHLLREASLLRPDGSLDFYLARQKVAAMLLNAIGEFRDYNGGILIKQQELLEGFKQNFPAVASLDSDLMESFFYGLTPLEKQTILPQSILATLFTHFLENRKEKLPAESVYSLKIFHNEEHTFIIVHGIDYALAETISTPLQEQQFGSHDMAYNIIDTIDGVFFNCVLLNVDNKTAESFIHQLQEVLHGWHRKLKANQILRIGLEYSLRSLDPRIGGESVSGDVIKLLFEGLTRFDQNGNVENAIAETIEVSRDLKHYVFKLRNSFWNDGSQVTAHDFEYAWKKILSPDFKTAFAYPFYCIKNAQEAKERKVPAEMIGIKAIDNLTLHIDLVRPFPYFLQWTAHPVYSPVHRIIDQQHPQWPYQKGKNYPCNGPFELKINQPEQGYQLVKNPLYWDTDHIKLSQVLFTPVTPAEAIQSFQKGELDWIGNPFGGWHPFYSASNEDNIFSSPNSSVCWCVFNTAQPPFSNRKLRQAFAHAIERSRIIANAYIPLRPAYSPLLPQKTKNSAPLFPEADVEQAHRLLHEALQELNLRKEELPPIKLIFNAQGIREYTAQCLKEQFKEYLGLECILEPLPWNALFSKLNAGDFELGLIYWASWINDPLYTLNTFKTAKQEINFTRWESPRYQQLIDLYEQEINPVQRNAYLVEAESILNQEMPLIPLFYQPYQVLVHQDLCLFCRTPSGPFQIAKSYFHKGNIT